jgi:hypothetical protein
LVKKENPGVDVSKYDGKEVKLVFEGETWKVQFSEYSITDSATVQVIEK